MFCNIDKGAPEVFEVISMPLLQLGKIAHPTVSSTARPQVPYVGSDQFWPLLQVLHADLASTNSCPELACLQSLGDGKVGKLLALLNRRQPKAVLV